MEVWLPTKSGLFWLDPEMFCISLCNLSEWPSLCTMNEQLENIAKWHIFGCDVTVGQIKWPTCSKHSCVAFMCLFLTSWHLPFNISSSVLHKFTIFALTLQLSLYMLHTCLHSLLSCCNHSFLNVFLSFSHSTLLGYQMLQGATMQQLQQVQVQSQGTPITVNTRAFMYLQITHTHTRARTHTQSSRHTHTSQCSCSECFWWLLYKAPDWPTVLRLIKVTAVGDQMTFSK